MCVPPPPPPELPIHAESPAHNAITRTNAASRPTAAGERVPPRRLPAAAAMPSSRRQTTTTGYPRRLSPGPPPGRVNGTMERAWVTTMTFTLAGADPFIGTVEGLTLHVAFAGAPLQLSVTDWLNPPSGVTCS